MWETRAAKIAASAAAPGRIFLAAEFSSLAPSEFVGPAGMRVHGRFVLLVLALPTVVGPDSILRDPVRVAGLLRLGVVADQPESGQ